jgi:hypothetical protein
MHSYPSIYNLGRKLVADFFKAEVSIEEKVDGSQFSFGVDKEGILHVRSKGATLYVDAPEKMFTKAVETAKALAPNLVEGWTYRGEYLRTPKHNALAYNRVPDKNFILFDVDMGNESFVDYHTKAEIARILGLEVVPQLFQGYIASPEGLRGLLDRESVLGGQKIEGIVCKRLPGQELYGPDKKPMLLKFVSESFREVHKGEWKKENPSSNDILDMLGSEYRTPARWSKAVIHLAERGQLTDSPQDIGRLLKEVGSDVHKECADEIRDKLFKWAWPHVQRKITAGLPEWYKDELLKKQFDKAA